jgi:CRISPR-associated protein Csx14
VRILVPPPHSTFEIKWGLEIEELKSRHEPFSQRFPQKPASLPAVLINGSQEILVDSWGDTTNRDSVKFWAGSGGYPGAALLRDALDLIRDGIEDARHDPFAVAAPQKSSFRFDWRRDYVPMGIGFSLNEHAKIVPLGYPLVEILAAIGLQHARPQRPNRLDKLKYRYAVIGGKAVPAALHRAALGCTQLPFATRTFRMILDWPGKENQARCITSVAEEPTP